MVGGQLQAPVAFPFNAHFIGGLLCPIADLNVSSTSVFLHAESNGQMNNYQTANTDTVTQLKLRSVTRAKYRQVDQGLQSPDWPCGRYSILSNKYLFPQEINQLGMHLNTHRYLL
jgi:hypothetical protein